MDFFAHQEDARRRTSRLVALFAAAVAGIIAALYLAVLVVLKTNWSSERAVQQFISAYQAGWWHPALFSWTAAIVLATVLTASLFRTKSLSRGGAAIAEMLDARPVAPDTAAAGEKRLINIVEEMAIASGIPVPGVYLMGREDGINAFAAGLTTHDAVIGVTRGCLDRLNRDELQGVVAHEFSHILNGDMRLNIRLMGILHGILVIGIAGYGLFRSALFAGPGTRGRRHGGRRQGSGNPLPLILLGLMVMAIGYIGVFFGKLIKSAVSREREYLADAAAVQFTRNPAGIAGALKKIGGTSALTGSVMLSPRAQEASHIFFASAVYSSFARLLDTHPSLETRVRRLDPSFDGVFPRSSAPEAARPAGPETPLPSAGAVPGAAPGPLPDPKQVLESVGTVNPEHLALAAALLEKIPGDLRRSAHDPDGALALTCAMLLSDDPGTRERQLQALRDGGLAEAAAAAPGLAAHLSGLAPEARLPLIDIALPALRRIGRERYLLYRQAVKALVAADSKVSLFEFTMQTAIARHLDPVFTGRPLSVIDYYDIRPLLPACAVLLSALARYGNREPGDAAQAYERGFAYLRAPRAEAMTAAEKSGHDEVIAALNTLSAASPALKKRIIDACLQCIWANRNVTAREAEMLRVTADILDCPVPPLIAGTTSGAPGPTVPG